MSKVKLSETELKALDALIAVLQDDESISSSHEDAAFPGALFRVITVNKRVSVRGRLGINVGGGNKEIPDLSEFTDVDGNLKLSALIQLREEANK